MNTPNYTEKLLKLLSLEYNCSPEDFECGENVLTESALLDGRRIYGSEKYFFHMCTLGGNAVITADPCLHSFLKAYIKDKAGHWLFKMPNLLPIEAELNKHSYTLTQSHHMFLPERRVGPMLDLPVKWYCGEEIHPFYGDERFPNAICDRFHPERPDRIAVVALDGEKLMGMAGCSEDAKGWMQIGIDVLPEYRSLGIATYLVTLLKNKIEEMGDIPFYGTSVSNYHSWNVALNCGFKPAWLEIGAKKTSV